MKELKYEVVWPLGKLAGPILPSRPGLNDLKGKTICELSDYNFRAWEVFPIVRESLQKRYPSIKFVDYSVFGNLHGPKERELVAALPGLLREQGCDAVISGVGA
ncbi:hypothetical protein ACFLWI_00005 [Chloroflexota bacterium]